MVEQKENNTKKNNEQIKNGPRDEERKNNSTNEGYNKKTQNKTKNHQNLKNKDESKDELAEIKIKYKKLEEEKKELELLLKRVAADFDNFKKRTENDKKDFRDYCKKELIKKFLSIIDNFELALNNTKNHEQFVKGIEMIYSQLMTFLEDEGVRVMNCENQYFDPKLHEPLMTKIGKEDNKIIEVIQKGYFLNNILLRPAKVIISKKESTKEENKSQKK